ETTDSWGFWLNLGQKITNAVNTGYGSAVSNGDVVMVALDLDNGKIWFGQDGTWEASGDPVAGTNAAYTTLAGKILRPAIGGQDATFDTTANFGQSAFAHTPPTDFKALCTANLPTPAIADPSGHFQTSLYTGTSASGNTVTQTGSSTFQPDMIWIKNRDTAKNHQVVDDLRGSNFNEQLHPNLTNAASGNAVVDSVEADGFTLGSSVEGNDSGEAHVGYQWLAANNDGGASDSSGNITVMRSTNVIAGFSIVTGTGNSGSGAYFGHGLNTVDFGIFKKNTTSQTWYVYSKVRRAQVGESVLHLDTSAASSIQSAIFGEPSSTQFYLDGGGVNSGTDNWLGLLWEAIPGFSAFGPYTGNGS
ncbi:MAG: hypothetical protein GY832_45115, partial [Chloroflexi bacterium]|nr:hypothetical protein [Chloroflexota bacterium]